MYIVISSSYMRHLLFNAVSVSFVKHAHTVHDIPDFHVNDRLFKSWGSWIRHLLGPQCPPGQNTLSVHAIHPHQNCVLNAERSPSIPVRYLLAYSDSHETNELFSYIHIEYYQTAKFVQMKKENCSFNHAHYKTHTSHVTNCLNILGLEKITQRY